MLLKGYHIELGSIRSSVAPFFLFHRISKQFSGYCYHEIILSIYEVDQVISRLGVSKGSSSDPF